MRAAGLPRRCAPRDCEPHRLTATQAGALGRRRSCCGRAALRAYPPPPRAQMIRPRPSHSPPTPLPGRIAATPVRAKARRRNAPSHDRGRPDVDRPGAEAHLASAPPSGEDAAARPSRIVTASASPWLCVGWRRRPGSTPARPPSRRSGAAPHAVAPGRRGCACQESVSAASGHDPAARPDAPDPLGTR